MDDAHRPRIDPHRGEAKMGMDPLLLGEGNGTSASEGSTELSGFSVGCSQPSWWKEVIVCVGSGTRGNIKFTGRLG